MNKLNPDDLYHKLDEAFCPTHLSVRDDSAKHAHHEGVKERGGGHYTVILVTEALRGLDRLSRHKAVMNILTEEFDQHTIHALSLRIFTPEEWQNAALHRTMPK